MANAQKYKITLGNGMFDEFVEVELFMNYLDSVDIHHLELDGPSISETGYRSMFLNDLDFDNTHPLQTIIKIVEELSGKKVKTISPINN